MLASGEWLHMTSHEQSCCSAIGTETQAWSAKADTIHVGCSSLVKRLCFAVR
ncbi:hypothetical protein HBI56_170290 [Parastagonospora nodorum]|uniref:Uncharacterized protein n=1 Tax=Phaeosphaeria nodorum (strain SN15 / ATCC MYA-4574 / FGSC 10173) TaxID=321614 RepID=A0A7U2FF79_PHANO|nr:hypothetical protein HBH56_245170 [Parastagonospora nodorum]QRD01915.1 hypothetical protein JI435_417370 [Parastagonospora nodorum SN15]KAH3935405.1 hypothetical protein HBH54_034240 [Parastagonospora nodorum]KAH3938676.1 hypothetical protein HBH53_247230 [Parastagonospora nodorum]KAH3964220.1 hypothetical protein HBH51_160090 [Parastagonospora nodorum]